MELTAPGTRRTRASVFLRIIGVSAAFFLGGLAWRHAIAFVSPQPSPAALAILRSEDLARVQDADADDSATPPADD